MDAQVEPIPRLPERGLLLLQKSQCTNIFTCQAKTYSLPPFVLLSMHLHNIISQVSSGKTSRQTKSKQNAYSGPVHPVWHTTSLTRLTFSKTAHKQVTDVRIVANRETIQNDTITNYRSTAIKNIYGRCGENPR